MYMNLPELNIKETVNDFAENQNYLIRYKMLIRHQLKMQLPIIKGKTVKTKRIGL